jgi:hypothetical protein
MTTSRVPSSNKQEKDAPHCIFKVVASLPSPAVSMLRNIIAGESNDFFLQYVMCHRELAFY